MSVKLGDLRNLLPRLMDGSISEPDLGELVRSSRVLIEAHLRYMRPSTRYLCIAQGITITDLAYDCIGSAFARDEHASFPHVTNLVASLDHPLHLMPEEEVFLAYKGFLTRFADTHCARLFAQADPAGAKIHRNIRITLKENTLFSLARDFRGYVLRPASADSLDHLDPFPDGELERLFFERCGKAQNTPELLGALHEVLVRQSAHRRSIPLAEVVKLFKSVYRSDDDGEAESGPRLERDSLTDFEIGGMRSQVELIVKEKILLTYLGRGKLDRRESEGLFCAIKDILEDWCNSDGPEHSLFDYLCRHMLISREAYESTYRVKLEYLVKIARDEFAALLARDI